MEKMADALDMRHRAAWLKSLDGLGGKPVNKPVASVAFLTIMLVFIDISNDLRPTPIAPDFAALRLSAARKCQARFVYK